MWWSRRETIRPRPRKRFCWNSNMGTAKDDKALEDLAREAHTQAVEKYLDGVREKWHPERLLVLGAGFKGRELAGFL